MLEVLNAISVGFVAMAPILIFAMILIIVGYIVGVIAKIIISRALVGMGVDEWFEEQNLLAAIGNKSFSEIIGLIAKWYIFFIFIKQAVELINLTTINEVLGLWIQYALAATVAIGVVIVGLIIGRFVRNAIEATDHSMKRLFGLILEICVVYIAVVMGISILGLPTMLLEFAFIIALTGVVISISVAIGLSFGFALKDEARTIVKELKKSPKKKK